MKTEQVLCCMFLLGVLVLTVYKTQQLFTSDCETRVIAAFWLRNVCIVYERKRKDCARSGTFRHLCNLREPSDNLRIFICSLDVCRAS